MNEIPIAVKKIKLSVPLKPDGLPGVPMEGPIGDLTIRLALEGSGFAVPARVNGKSYRRMMKTVAEKGAENVDRHPPGGPRGPARRRGRRAGRGGVPGGRQDAGGAGRG